MCVRGDFHAVCDECGMRGVLGARCVYMHVTYVCIFEFVCGGHVCE